MKRIVFPESDTEPEKYSRRSRQVRVFFAKDTESADRSVRIRRNRGPRKNFIEDSEDKPIQQNVRRSGRQRKLLHHNFNESWITNELKVRGYPGLYGIQGTSSSDESSSGDDGRLNRKKLTRSHTLAHTDDDTQSVRQRRTSARFSNKKLMVTMDEDTDSDNEKNQTVIEKKPPTEKRSDGQEKDTQDTPKKEMKSEPEQDEPPTQDSESNQGPARSTRGRNRRCTNKKEDFSQPETAKTFTIRKKPYSLRERKPKMLRRKTMRSQSPTTSTSSSTSSDTEEDLNVSMKNKTKGRQKSKSTDDKKTDRALRDIQPVEVDGSVRFTSVGGLDDHIKCLREMVLFPLMYPDLFQKFNTRPAKGVLFHGPPGTGKTLLARALANECSIVGGRKVAFFVRKGADCLKKWVGESERHLKLLFQQANKMKPSIIFFDEIDALAPVRSVRQEQVHTSVVGTLLAEMDGLCDRGEVVVIGATNRLDAVDPALRRAGRFDRELFFPPPHASARRDILMIHTKDWSPKPEVKVIEEVAELTNGYGGSDLKALCSEAVLQALRRVYPQVYESEHALLIDANNVEVTKQDMLLSMKRVSVASGRGATPAARPLSTEERPLLQAQLRSAMQQLHDAVLPDASGENSIPKSGLARGAFLLVGPLGARTLAPALLARLERRAHRDLSLATLHSALAYSPEQALISVFSECRRADNGCVLFVRDIPSLMESLGPHGTTLFVQLWNARAAGDDTLLLATTDESYDDLPPVIQDLFPLYKDCVFKIREPNATEVMNFLTPIITQLPLDPPVIENKEPPPPLPLAPPPPPPRESEEEIARRKRKEDYKLRELRIFLRDICRKLASNRRFYKFTKPVDLEEVTDYLDIIKQPMDLETIMTKVDMHKYNCAKEFLDDVDLICANALEYNPDKTSSDKQIRHEACSLRDHAHALIDVEMDSDFELECQRIASTRAQNPASTDDLPAFIYTANTLPVDDSKEMETHQNGDKSESHSAKRKRRRIHTWSRGFVSKRQKTAQKTYPNKDMAITDEESKENKPITSTPLPNGDAHNSSSEEFMSDDDAPLRRKTRDEQESVFNITAQTHHTEVKTGLLGSATKTSTAKTSPKKRNSGHETSSGDGEKVLINKTELENLLFKNTKALRSIGLEALLDLHAQLSIVLSKYSKSYDRTKLPHEYEAVISRYIHRLGKK